MTTRQPHIAVRSAVRPPAGVMVGVIAGPDQPTSRIAQALSYWWRLTPLATWAAVTLRSTDRAGIIRVVDAALESGRAPGGMALREDDE